MARLVAPLLSMSASGIVGGCQYARSRTGPVVGRRSIATRHQTAQSCLSRANHADICALWQTLLPHELTAWSNTAPPGQTAWSSFCAANHRRRRFSLPILRTPWIGTLPHAPSELTITVTPSATPRLNIAWSGLSTPSVFVCGSVHTDYHRRTYIDPRQAKHTALIPSHYGALGFNAPGPCNSMVAVVECIHHPSGALLRRDVLQWTRPI